MMLIQLRRPRRKRSSFWAFLLAGLSVLPLLAFSTSFAQQESSLSVPANDRFENERDQGRIHSEVTGEENWNVSLVGRWIGGLCFTVAVKDSIAYAGVVGGLIVVDFTSLDAPVEITQFPLPGRCRAIHISGHLAYVADGSAGLRIVDISNPASPMEIGFYVTDGYANDVAVSGNYAYVADDANGLRVIDVANPAAPFEVGYHDTGRYALGVAVSGNYAYVANESDGLRVIDVSNPAVPFEAGYYDTGGWANDVAVSGNYAYVADDSDGLRVIDVSNPADPQEVGSYDSISAYNLVVSGNYAYVGSGVRFRVIDISDPAKPLEAASRLSWAEPVSGIAIEGDLAYVANSRRGVRVRDISDPEDPDPVGQYKTGDAVYGVAVDGDYAYIAESSYGLRVFDVSNPMVPTAIGGFDAPGSGHDIAVRGHLAYLAAEMGGLRVIDISDPTDPQEVAFHDPDDGGWAYNVRLRGNYAYITASGLSVVNISDPMTLFEESRSELLSSNGVAVSGDYAYLVGGVPGPGTGWLRAINISDPANQSEESVYPTDKRVRGVDVSGNYVYMAVGPDGLHVIDISDPAGPVEVGSYDPDKLYANNVTVRGHYAYVAYNDGLRVIDVSDPLAPVEAGFHGTFLAWRSAVRGDHVYVADHWSGFYILEYIVPKAAGAYLDIRPGSCPNPLNVNVPNGEKANGGVLPVAVLGSDEFDVHGIDVSSLELEGATPLRYDFKDIAAPPAGDEDCACYDAGPDGHIDLTLKFSRLEVAAALGKNSGEGVPVTLTGRMKDGTPIEISDCVKIVPRKGGGGPQLTPTNESAVTALGRATPNPFNPTTVINYALAEQGYATLKVYDVMGKLVATLVDGELPGGRHEVTWDASGVPSGVYFYRLNVGSFNETRKLVLLK
jgi:hypothetical protein